MEKIYVIGHMNPDTDTIVSAMSLAALLNMKENTDRYTPAIAGKPNSETEYIFKRFSEDFPEILEDATGKKLFLVDHNEASQYVKGASVENIVGIVDHHKIKFENSSPIFINMRPWGSTNTIVYDMFKKCGKDIPEKLKPLMLCAIISDTVILKSPTTTLKDMEVVEKLSGELKLDYQELGMEMFKAKAKISEKSPEEIINNDFKNFDFSGKKVGIGQIETPEISEVETKAADIIDKMDEMRKKGSYHTMILVITDIIQEGSKLLIVSEDAEMIAGLYKTDIKKGITSFIPGMMSRKKQVAPILAENL